MIIWAFGFAYDWLTKSNSEPIKNMFEEVGGVYEYQEEAAARAVAVGYHITPHWKAYKFELVRHGS